STGASNDFQRATAIATKMITEYGMSEKIGPTQFNGDGGGGEVFLGRDIGSEKNYSDAIAHEIDVEIQTFINTCYENAKQILTEHREQLELIAEKLLEVETLTAEQIQSLFEDGVMPEEPEIEDAEIVKDVSDNQEDHDVKVNITSKDEDEPTAESYEDVKRRANKPKPVDEDEKDHQEDNQNNPDASQDEKEDK